MLVLRVFCDSGKARSSVTKVTAISVCLAHTPPSCEGFSPTLVIMADFHLTDTHRIQEGNLPYCLVNTSFILNVMFYCYEISPQSKCLVMSRDTPVGLHQMSKETSSEMDSYKSTKWTQGSKVNTLGWIT